MKNYIFQLLFVIMCIAYTSAMKSERIEENRKTVDIEILSSKLYLFVIFLTDMDKFNLALTSKLIHNTFTKTPYYYKVTLYSKGSDYSDNCVKQLKEELVLKNNEKFDKIVIGQIQPLKYKLNAIYYDYLGDYPILNEFQFTLFPKGYLLVEKKDLTTKNSKFITHKIEKNVDQVVESFSKSYNYCECIFLWQSGYRPNLREFWFTKPELKFKVERLSGGVYFLETTNRKTYDSPESNRVYFDKTFNNLPKLDQEIIRDQIKVYNQDTGKNISI